MSHRNLFVGVSAFFLLSCILWAGSRTLRTGSPHIVCDAPIFDFGQKPAPGKIEHRFVLRNSGDKVLEISKIRPDCGCMMAEVKAKTIPPGEALEIPASLSLHGLRGKQDRRIVVESNDPQRPFLLLIMKGAVAQDQKISESKDK